MDTSAALRVIDQLALVNPEAMLVLSGGEPLLREDIFELAAHASHKGMMVVLGSNGLLIDDRIVTELRLSGVRGISISLDSVTPGIHDEVRSLAGAWEKSVRAIEMCRRQGLSVQINAVVTKRNVAEMQALIQYSHALGAKVFSPFFLVCTGRGEELTDITPQQYEEVLALIVESHARCGDMMIRTRCAPTFRKILYQAKPDSPLLRMDTGRCLAGVHYCRITPEGNVTPCPYLPLSVGNVTREDFGELWAHSEVFVSLRNPSLKGRCGRCEFRMMCGGCRARAYASCGDYMEEDPWCAFIPKGGKAIEVTASDPCPGNGPTDETIVRWNAEAVERLKKVPFFVRSMVKSAVEKYARERGYHEISPEIMKDLRQKAGRMGIDGH